MRYLFAKTAVCALCAMALTIPTFATEASTSKEDTLLISAQTSVILQPSKLWGQLAWDSDDCFLLENQSQDDTWLIHTSHDQTLWIDAVTGTALDTSTLRDGDTVYVYAGPAMTMSLPPQTTAMLVIGNIPAGFGVPSYHLADGAIAHAQDGILVCVGEETLEIPSALTLELFGTQQETATTIASGDGLLVWYGMDGAISRVMVINKTDAEDFSGQLSVADDQSIVLDDVALQVAAKDIDGTRYLPLRAIGEAMGYSVYWDDTLGACVSQGETLIYAIYPDGETCFVENGISYVEASVFMDAMGL